MNKEVLFSIIIPTYNRAELLKRCLDSVEAQTYKNWEAIVVDNFSEDNTEEVVSSYHDQRIRYVKNHNYGIIAVSRNKALDIAKGDWLCFLDSDDQWKSSKLEILLHYVDDYDFLYHEMETNVKKTRLFQRTKSSSYDIGEMSIQEVLRRGDPVCTSCAAVSLKALGNTRFSEEKNLFAVEDYDFFLQLVDKRIRIKRIKEYLTMYDYSEGCSHGRFALDRDRQVYIKYYDRLTKEDVREIIKYYYYRKAGFFYHPGSYLTAMNYFSIAATSKSKEVRNKGLYAMFKSFLLYILNISKEGKGI